MHNGRIQQIGAPSEVYDQPENLFVAGFLGAPAMNFVHGQLALAGNRPAFVSAAMKLDLAHYAFRQPPVDGQNAILGIRPEHLRIAPQGQMQGVVTLVEPMGNHQVVWIDCQGSLLAGVVHEWVEFRPDAPVRFDIDLTRASVFDQASEQRL